MNDPQITHVVCKTDGSVTLHVGDRLQYRWHPALRMWQKCLYSPQGHPMQVEWADPAPRHLLKHQHLLPPGALRAAPSLPR